MENKVKSEIYVTVNITNVTDMMYSCSRENQTIVMKNRLCQPRNDSVIATFQ